MAKATISLAFGALAIRLLLIFPGSFESKVEMLANKADLRNYYWPAQIALRGGDPYTLWANGQSEGYRADMAPLELAVFVGTVAIWNDPRAIQVLFALCDTLNIVLLGAVLKSSALKLPFQVFYAFGPLTLYNLTLVPEDKTIVLSLTLILFYAMAARSSRFMSRVSSQTLEFSAGNIVIAIAALIAAFKWLSIFYLLPLLVFVSQDLREFLKNALVFAAILVLAHAPWFPAWSYVYIFRATRVVAPYHISPGVVLSAVGAYTPMFLLLLLALSLLTVYFFYWRGRFDIYEAIALSTLAGIFWTPDMDPVHLSLVVVSLLLVTNWASPMRQIVIWALGFFVAAVYAVTTHSAFGSFNLAALQKITGVYASPQMILLSYVLFIAVLTFYLWDKWRGRAAGRAVIEPGISES